MISFTIGIFMWLLFVLSIIALFHRINAIGDVFGYSPYAEKINEVFYNLSYSYLAGLIFYIINDWIPRQFREYRARKALSVEINELKQYLDNINRIIISVERQTGKNEVTMEDVKGKKMFTGIIWLKYSTPRSNPTVLKIDVEQHLQHYSIESMHQLDAIIQSPLFLDLNKSFANTIIHLKRDPFINSYAYQSKTTPGTDGFKRLYNALNEKVYIKYDNIKITKPSVDETLKAEANSIL